MARGRGGDWAWLLVAILLGVGVSVAVWVWQEREESRAELREEHNRFEEAEKGKKDAETKLGEANKRADEILKELEEVRKAKEKASAQLVSTLTPSPAPAPAPERRAAAPVPPVAPKPKPRDPFAGTYEGQRKDLGAEARMPLALRWCPEGTFTMGSPENEEGRWWDEPNRKSDERQHEVTLTQGFWMAETEVTQGQWKEIMGETVLDLARRGIWDDTEYDFNDGKGPITNRKRWDATRDTDPQRRCGAVNDDVPVYNVSWDEAKTFCKRLTDKGHGEGWLPAGYSFRLPTEAEWEYACRAGTKTALPNRKEIRILGKKNAPALDDIAWYGGNSSEGLAKEGLDVGGAAWVTDSWPERQYDGNHAAPRKVKGKEHNKWGLYDMIGNVWEWCEDESAAYPTGPVTDYCKSNSSTASGVHRVMRGGSWCSDAQYCRSADRGWYPAGYRVYLVGFRPVCSARTVQ